MNATGSVPTMDTVLLRSLAGQHELASTTYTQQVAISRSEMKITGLNLITYALCVSLL